jgi:hypothetical protein
MLGSAFGFPHGLFLGLLLGLPLGCAHLKDSGQDEDLDHAVDLYWKATHWQDAIAGSVLVAPEVRSEWLHTRDKQEKNLNVTSYEIQGEKIDKGGFSASVIAKVTWFLLPSLVEQTELVQQRWVYSASHWMVSSEKGGPLPFP